MSEAKTHIICTRTDWIDLSKPLPWWLNTRPSFEARVMTHDDRRKARGKAKVKATKRRRAG
jgi:hypothetical protein